MADPTPIVVRYPGEECTQDGDCFKQGDDSLGKCQADKTCSGRNETDKCLGNFACKKGLYCDKDGTCKKQKGKDESCANSYECINTLLCHGSKCNTAPFSLDVNTTLDAGDALNADKCKYGLSSRKNATDPASETCTTYTQSDAGDAKGFVTCSLGSLCNYTDVTAATTVSKPCPCGYNADGQGYCPLGYNKRDSDYTSYYTKLAATYSSDCHTLSRKNCYKAGDDTNNKLAATWGTLGNEHLFYKSVDCAHDVLSGNYVSVSMIMISLLVSLLF
jgi:hypothetical protein